MTESTPLWQTCIAYSSTWKRFQLRCEWCACVQGHFLCVNVHLHCNVSNLKKISKMSTLPAWKKFFGRPRVLWPFQQAFTYGQIKLSQPCTKLKTKQNVFRGQNRSWIDRQTDRHFLFNIWKNQISGGGEWPQGLRVILPREIQVELHRRRPKVYKIHIGLHISAKTVQTYPQDISTHKQDMKTKRRGTTQLQQTSGKIQFL